MAESNPASSDTTYPELKNLKADLQTWQMEMKELLNQAKTQSALDLEQIKLTLGEALEHLENQLQIQYQHYYTRFTERGREALENTRLRVETKPFAHLFGAFTAGLITGLLIFRR